MNILDYLIRHINDDQLIQAVSEYLDISIPVNEVQALKDDTRLLLAIYVNPLLQDCYTSTGRIIKHSKDCVINLMCRSLQKRTQSPE